MPELCVHQSVTRWGMCVLAGIVLPACVPALAFAGELDFGRGDLRLRVRVATEPPAGEWSASADGNGYTSTSGYRLGREADGDVHTFTLTRPDGAGFRVIDWSYETRVPLGGVVAVFDTRIPEGPSIFRQAPQTDVVLEVRPNAGIPFILGANHHGANSLAAGPLDQRGTYRIVGRAVQDEYVVTIRREEFAGDGWLTAGAGEAFKDAVFISTRPDYWFDVAQAYADAVDAAAGYESRPIRPQARRPYYSTWYAFREHIDERKVWDNAVVASQIGVGNFVIFIGWAQCHDWFSSDNEWGDYTACPERFADLVGLIARIQRELKMDVQLWIAPTWLSTGSKVFERAGQFRSKWPGGDYDRNLDVRSPAARRHIREQLASMAARLGADGVYVDFLDTLFNRNDSPHPQDPGYFGAGLEQFMQACYQGLASKTDAPTVIYRTPFANLLSKRHASVLATTYCDGRWERSRLLAIAHRPFARGAVTLCDPLTWTPEQFDDRDRVGAALSAVLFCGPPAISMDLTRLDERRRRDLAAWFDFYERHRERLSAGRFIPFGREFHCPEMMIAHGETAYAWVSRWETDHIPFPPGTRHAFIFTNLPREESFIARIDLTNVTGLRPGRYRARWYNSTLESHDPPFELTVAERSVPASHGQARTPRENWDFVPGGDRPSLDIRRGGYLELEWVE